MKLQKNDTIEVVKGKDKGKTGKIERTYPQEDMVLIPGVNEYKRHIKGKMQGQKSEIVTFSRPLPVSNVALVCSHCKKKTRVGYLLKDDKKLRVCRKCDEIL